MELIQTAIKSSKGQGKMIMCKFEAPLNSHEPFLPINYNLDSFESDMELLKTGDDHKYCLKKCHEMGDYMQKIRGLELLEMHTEWFKDDNGFIWLFIAENISVRPLKGKAEFFPGTMSKNEFMKQERLKHRNRELVKEQLVQELDAFEK